MPLQISVTCMEDSMAPPRKKNPSFPEKGFEKYNVTVTDPTNGKPRTYAEYRPKRGSGYDILTDDALISVSAAQRRRCWVTPDLKNSCPT